MFQIHLDGFHLDGVAVILSARPRRMGRPTSEATDRSSGLIDESMMLGSGRAPKIKEHFWKELCSPAFLATVS